MNVFLKQHLFVVYFNFNDNFNSKQSYYARRKAGSDTFTTQKRRKRVGIVINFR